MSTDDDQGYKNEHSSFIEQLSSNRFGNYSLSSSYTVDFVLESVEKIRLCLYSA